MTEDLPDRACSQCGEPATFKMCDDCILGGASVMRIPSIDELEAADAEAFQMAEGLNLVSNIVPLHVEPLAPGELAAAYDRASDAREAFLIASKAFESLLPRYRPRGPSEGMS